MPRKLERSMRDAEELSLRDQLEQVMPEGGRARRLLGLEALGLDRGSVEEQMGGRLIRPAMRQKRSPGWGSPSS